MPTENERKFVLRLDSEPEIAKQSWAKLNVVQGYLDGVRVRAQQVEGGIRRYYLTYKRQANNRLIEIETEIDYRDFLDLWEHTTHRVYKRRYLVDATNGHEEAYWEIDYFMQESDHEVYFAMAEVEMPEGQSEPVAYPPQFDNHVIYNGASIEGMTGNGFISGLSSKELSDPEHAKLILEMLTRVKNGRG